MAEPAAIEVSPEVENEMPGEGVEIDLDFEPPAPIEEKPPTPPPTVADALETGRKLKREFKIPLKLAEKPIIKPPQPAKPKPSPEVQRERRRLRRLRLCQQRHASVGGVGGQGGGAPRKSCRRKAKKGCSVRVQQIAKPPRRYALNTWKDYCHLLSPHMICRLRVLIEGEESYKPEQAYEFFKHIYKAKKKELKERKRQEKEMYKAVAVAENKRLRWSQNACVLFARGIQRQLDTPRRYNLTGGLQRLSDAVLREVCTYMRMRIPERDDCRLKAQFIIEIANKITVWMDQVLCSADRRLLEVDYDLDEDIDLADKYDEEEMALYLARMAEMGGEYGESELAEEIKEENV